MKALRYLALLTAMVSAITLCSCNNESTAAIRGDELFDLSGCESVSFSLGSIFYDVTDKSSVESVCTLLSELNYTIINNTRPPAGGILTSFQTPNDTVVINVCGSRIGLNGQWYQATVDIGEQLEEYMK